MSSARPAPATSATQGVADLGYEQARDELVAVVARLEAGAGTLEESLALWERGQALAARCQEWLDGARARLSAATGPEGNDHLQQGLRPDSAQEGTAAQDEGTT